MSTTRTPPSGDRRRRLAFWVLHTLGWSLYGFFYVILYASGLLENPRALSGIAVTYAVGYAVSLGLRMLYRWVRVTIRSMPLLALIVALAVLFGSQIWYWLDVLVSLAIFGGEVSRFVYPLQQYAARIYGLAIVFLTWSALYFGILLWYEWGEERERTEKARLLAESAQLQMLRYQLNPHFLFNALNSIRALVDDNREKARTAITALSDFLRYTLNNAHEGSVCLDEELDAIRRYFDIERIRYEEKLIVEFAVTPEAGRVPVPGFLVHPLVENAVKYGMRTSAMPVRIRVFAALRESGLTIRVWNSGAWVPASAPPDDGDGTRTGLVNIRRRLDHAFPGRHHFDIGESDGGVAATITIHLKEKSGHAT